MAQQTVEQRLRRFLLAVVAAIFIGSIFELILLDHHEETLQWVPFIVSGIGFIMVGAVWFTPSPTAIKAFRWVMAGVALTSIVGIGLHFNGNLEFTREINPSYSLAESIWPAMKGSYPLLAPGILFLAGILGIAAMYRHPLLDERVMSDE
jgi:hypothetical protein